MKTPRHRIRDLLQTGKFTCAEIAQQVGVCRQRVYQVAAQERARAELEEQQRADASRPFHEWRLACLPMSVRLRNCCRNVGPDTRSPNYPDWRPPTPAMITVGDLLHWTAVDLLNLKNFGRFCLNEVRELLAAHGLPSEQYRITDYRPAPEPPPTPPPIAPRTPRVILVLPTASGTH